MLDRREAAFLFAGVAFGGALLGPLECWLLGDAEMPRTGLAGSVGYQEVEQIENASRIFRDWDDQFGGGLRRVKLAELYRHSNAYTNIPVIACMRERIRSLRVARNPSDCGGNLAADRYHRSHESHGQQRGSGA